MKQTNTRVITLELPCDLVDAMDRRIKRHDLKKKVVYADAIRAYIGKKQEKIQ
jgi:metal-responsive CopG/Arc/MetJ family transcriptional regulator